MTIPWVLFRGLYWFLVQYGRILGPAKDGTRRYGRFIREQTEPLGLAWSDAEASRLIARELAFQTAVLGEAAGPGETDAATYRRNLKSRQLAERRLRGLAKRNLDIAFRGYRKVVRLGGRMMSGGDGD